MKTRITSLIVPVVTAASIFMGLLGCKPSVPRKLDTTLVSQPKSNRNVSRTATFGSAPLSLQFVVLEEVSKILKRKCYICHGGAKVKGGFDFKKIVYQPNENADWQSMDLAGVTRIKLAILPLDGKPPRMPKRAGSILNSLTQEEANTVAKWTDYPYER